MKTVSEQTVPYNTGWAGDMKKGQVIRITATTTVDFVALDRHNLRERFDQARTKVYNGQKARRKLYRMQKPVLVRPLTLPEARARSPWSCGP